MKIFFINNSGGGFCGSIEIEPGTTVKQLFEDQVPYSEPQDFLIRVNRLPVAADEILQDGARVSVTPLRIEGAGSRIGDASKRVA
jgi:hypothetical protein